MGERPLLILVLAAGKGTRMKSARPKVLHEIAGRSLLGHVMDTARSAGASKLAVVVGPDMGDVRAEIERVAPGTPAFEQPRQLGTADAVLAARPALAAHRGDVIVLAGDVPLFTAATIGLARAALAAGADLAVVGFKASDPTGYGRLLLDGADSVRAIREHKDANPEERAVTLCNSGVIGFRTDRMLEVLDEIGNDNVQGEYYLPDAIEIARRKGLAVHAVLGSESEMLGVNDRVQLAAAEALFQARKRREVMLEGATLVAPETVIFSHDTRIGRDVLIEPYVVFGPGVVVEDGVVVRAFSHLVGADRKNKSGTRVGAGAEIGPFTRLRPGANLGRDVHIGNFVEVKNVTLEDGAKANHLAYLGDGRVGAKANIGAGTIFCNYDGFAKHRTEIGSGAFIGSNSSLVAPVRIGDGAFVGSGSVITQDVPADSLAVERSKQEIREGWAAKFRSLMSRKRK